MKDKLNFNGWDRDILIYVFRYTLGRRSYAPSTVQEAILNNWDVISDGDKKLFVREIKEYYNDWGLGSEFDRSSWFKIVERYEGKL